MNIQEINLGTAMLAEAKKIANRTGGRVGGLPASERVRCDKSLRQGIKASLRRNGPCVMSRVAANLRRNRDVVLRALMALEADGQVQQCPVTVQHKELSGWRLSGGDMDGRIPFAENAL